MRSAVFVLNFFLILNFSFAEQKKSTVNFVTSDCQWLLVTPESVLISYLQKLIDLKILSQDELYRFKEKLEVGQLKNPIFQKRLNIESIVVVHFNAIEILLQENYSPDSIQRILKWINDILKKTEEENKSKEDSEKKTKALFLKMDFVEVPAGSFRDENHNIYSINYSFEVQSTLVTWFHWRELFPVDEKSMSGIFEGRHQSASDYPRTFVTWWAAAEFANQVSLRFGLKPFYDFSNIRWKPGTSLEDGSLIPESGYKFELKAIETLSDGFRLPTSQEQEYLMSGLGKFENGYFFGFSDKDLTKYAWHKANSNKVLHEVGLLKPMLVGEKSIFDVCGLVWQWSNDAYNEKNFTTGISFITKGGCYTNEPKHVLSRYVFAGNGDSGFGDTGFRLVRTIKKTQ